MHDLYVLFGSLCKPLLLHWFGCFVGCVTDCIVGIVDYINLILMRVLEERPTWLHATRVSRLGRLCVRVFNVCWNFASEGSLLKIDKSRDDHNLRFEFFHIHVNGNGSASRLLIHHGCKSQSVIHECISQSVSTTDPKQWLFCKISFCCLFWKIKIN